MGIIFYSASKVGGGGMQYNRVEICGVNTSKLKVLKEKEKTELLRRMHSGDKSARDELINGNLRLVLSSGLQTGERTPMISFRSGASGS